MSKFASGMGYSLSTVVFAASLSVVGMERAIAEPAPVFRPVLREIQQKLPQGMVMRLPSLIELRGINDKPIRLYSQVKDAKDGLYIRLVSQPNCEAYSCYMGGISVSRSSLADQTSSGGIRPVSVTLSPGILGTYSVVSRGDGAVATVAWKQDNLNYSVVLRVKMMNSKNEEPGERKRVIETAISMAKEPSINSVGGSVTASNTTDKSCITWSRYVKDLPTEGGRGSQWWKYGQLPAKFQQGCVVLDDGNAIDRAWILQSGLDIKPYSQPSSQSYQKLPIPNNSNALDRLVNQGKAVLVTWLTPTNGSLQYLRSIPKDRPFLRDDGMTCLNTVCLKSAALSHRELSQILAPGIAKSPQPSTPSNQTARTPAASTPSSVAVTIESEAIRIGSQNRKTLLKCTEEKPCVEDQIVIDRYQEVFNRAGKIQNVKLALYNTSFAFAAVEVYSATGKQKTVEYIDGTKPGFKDWEDLLKTTTAGLLEPFRCVGSGWVQCWNQFKYNKYGVERKELTLQLDPGDVIRISRSSDAALAYTVTNTIIDVVELAGSTKDILRTGRQGIPLPLANTQYSPRLKKEIVKGFLREEIGGKYTWKMLREEFIKDACRKSCSNPSKLLDISLDILKNIPDEFWKKTTDGSIAARAAGDGLDALIVSIGGSSSAILKSAFFLSQSANIYSKMLASSVASQKPRHIVIAGFDQK